LKPVVLTRQAALELAAARRWYDRQELGLGSDLVAEFQQAAAFIMAYPDAAPELERGYRRRVLRRFPYAVVYLDAGEVLLAVAVWHCSRNPVLLAKRLRRRS